MVYQTLFGESVWVCLVVSVALHTTNICAVFVLIARLRDRAALVG